MAEALHKRPEEIWPSRYNSGQHQQYRDGTSD
ncbi:MAG: helix-turn-helix domain-containing protein [Hafnia alvei]